MRKTVAVGLTLLTLSCKSKPDQAQKGLDLPIAESHETAPPLADDPGEGEDHGQAMALDEGKMGKADADPQLARQQAIEQAKQAGILGTGRYATIGGGM